jgi:4-amino-4-deoxy-L-arabinose transferase-like glycosyltransferase
MKTAFINRKWFQAVSLATVLSLTFFLTFFNSWGDGLGNLYYASAIRSMLQSFHNFFFVAFDPGGFVSVDKPPVALWIQTLFAQVFGFHGWSILLPEALSAVFSVLLIYHLVKRVFGFYAGIASALALAFSPIFIAVSRTNNLDSILVLDMLVSAWLLIRATESGSVLRLIAAMAMAGIGFNIKMFEAYLIIPAFYLTYFLLRKKPLKKSIAHLGLATVVLLLISFSWALAVDATPASDRPYVGSSRSDSEIELAFGYNGIERVFSGFRLEPAEIESRINTLVTNIDPQNAKAASATGSNAPPAGILRLFDKSLGGQIAWFIPLSIFGMAAFYIWSGRNRATMDRKMLVNAVFWTGWISVMLVFFSFSNITHKYYLSVLAPGLAAATGIGLVFLWRLYREKGKIAVLLPAMLVCTAVAQFILTYLYYPHWNGWLGPVIIAVCTAGALLLMLLKVHRIRAGLASACFVLSVSALFVAPALWSAMPLIYGTSMGDPHASPPNTAEQSAKQVPAMRPAHNAGGKMRITGISSSKSKEAVSSHKSGATVYDRTYARTYARTTSDYFVDLSGYLVKNRDGSKYIVAVTEAGYAENIILTTGLPVMTVGGYSGNDPILTLPQFERLVDSGDVRYFLVANARQPAGTKKIVRWVEEHGTEVNQGEITGVKAGDSYLTDPNDSGYSLYDIRPHTAKTAVKRA